MILVNNRINLMFVFISKLSNIFVYASFRGIPASNAGQLFRYRSVQFFEWIWMAKFY